MFQSTKTSVADLLKAASLGEIKLPEFQRGWVWDDYGIRSLLASISQGFPVGAVMALEAGGPVEFQARPIEGAPASAKDGEEDLYLLDGQQRLTSLFQATYSDAPVDTQNAQRRKVKRWYYIDMELALSEGVDREEAIVSVPESRIETADFGREETRNLSTPEHEYQNLMFPVNKLFRDSEWQQGFFEYWDLDREKVQLWMDFNKTIIQSFVTYQVPVITLLKNTSREAVCLIFEKVNTGGKKLDAFELLTAIYASHTIETPSGERKSFSLRHDWLGDPETPDVPGRYQRLAKTNILSALASTDFLQAVALLHTRELRLQELQAGKEGKQLTPVSPNRKSMLAVPLQAYLKWADPVEEGFQRAAKLLTLEKIFWVKDLPYQSQLAPLAAILVILGERWTEMTVRRRLMQWYWCGVFGELYGSASETRMGKDVMEVPAWIDGGDRPTTIYDAQFSHERLGGLRTRLSAAYKGVNALLMRHGAEDFLSGQPFEYANYWSENVDIHHIFPKKWCQARKISWKMMDSIVNKTPISARANRMIGGSAPHSYLKKLEKSGVGDAAAMDVILGSHGIDPQALRADDFDAFFEARSTFLLDQIEAAMGKPVTRAPLEGEEPDAPESEHEDLPALDVDDFEEPDAPDEAEAAE